MTTVSVITVSYNSDKTIQDTIESVRDQTYPHIEYVVVDGGSTDETVDIIKQNKSVVDRWVSEPDDGIYDAMNKGIKMSSGEVIGILNSDDWYEPGTVEAVVSEFKEHDEVYLVYGAMKLWDEGGTKVSRCYGEKDGFSDMHTVPFNHPTCFVSREVYKNIGLFNTSFSTAADYDFMLRFKRSEYAARYVDRVLTNFRQGGITSQIAGSPYGQIWRVLRRNDYSWLRTLEAIGFRLLRDVASYGTNNLLPKPVRRVVRRVVREWIPYHRSLSK